METAVNTGSFVLQPRASEDAFAEFLRNVLRFWFGMFFRRIRVLNIEALSRTGPALLVVNHPPGFADALILNAAFDRPVHCLLEHRYLKSILKRWCARALDMIAYEFEGEDWPAALGNCCEIFARGGLVLVFARQQTVSSEEPASFAPEAAEIAFEAQTYLEREAPLPIHPVNLFLPVPPSQSDEVLISVGSSLVFPEIALKPGVDPEQKIKAVDEELERVCRQNPFRLRPEEIDQLIAGLEGVMREDFAERWARRENWKQRVEEFELSPFLIRLVSQLNYGHPGRLVALNEALQSYHEARRKEALSRFKIETAGNWFRNTGQRWGAWLETLVGFPIACYGLLNSLIAWLVLHLIGSLRKGLWEATAGEWAKRVIVTVICYAGQIALAAHFLPRSEAGYYAPSVFIAGGYLLRYLWLLEHRSHILVQTLGKERRISKLRRMRKALIEELKRDQDRYATLWKLVH
jgi:1-acyl-sn-glycerol-3-phosphate acyltransferase